ncbi:ChaN family lipoprotein [Acidaminococcus intestini]|nr:ChaN family lipoprotein [Acidaminococcus intestini]
MTELYRLVPDRLVLSLEMFEKDVQASLDAYLAGRMTEMEFLKVSRPWPNYERDYRHLVEFAKRRGFPSLRPMCRAASLPMWSNMAVQPAWFWKTPSTCPKTLNR